MVRKYFKKIIIISVVAVSLLFSSHTVFAADISVVSTSRAGVYDVVLSMTKHESVNAVEGTVLFKENAVVIPSTETNDSIISLWIKQPIISGNSINFSGIIPGGFSVIYDQFGGQPKTEGKLFSIVFPFIKDVKSYSFTLDSASVYANDGRGAAIVIPSKSFTLPANIDKNDFSSDTNVTSNPAYSVQNYLGPLIIVIVSIMLFLIIWIRRSKLS